MAASFPTTPNRPDATVPAATLPAAVKATLGEPLCAAVLSGACDSAPHAAGELRLWLPAEAMHAARLRSGQAVAVCVAAPEATAPAPPTPSSPFLGTGGSGGGGGIGGSPPDAAPLRPELLWAVLSSSCGAPLRPPLGDLSPTEVSAAALGAYAAVATAWPAPKLPRSAAVASRPLHEQLGCPASGRALLLYPLPPRLQAASAAAPAAASPAVDGKRAACFPAASRASLQLATRGDAGSGGGDYGGGSRSGEVRSAAGGGDQPQPVALVALPSLGGGSGAGQGGGAAAGAAAFGSPSPAKPGMPRTPLGQQQQRDTPGKGSAGGGGAGGSAAAQAQNMKVDGSSAASSWVQQALAEGGEEQAAVLRLLLRQHLLGRALLPGNPVLLPALGQRLVLQVLTIAPSVADPSAGGGGGEQAARVAPETEIEVAMPGTSGTGAGSDQQHQQGQQGQQQVGRGSPEAAAAAASKAAAAAVKGNGSGAAARAAAAAALAGARAAASGFEGVGGLQRHVHALRQLVGLPLRQPQLFRQYGLSPPRGVLLHGPPGTGKTLLCRSAARDAGAALLVLNGPDVLSEYLGESEAGLRGVFAAARALAPAIVFIDEIDALAPARAGPGSGSGGSGGGGATGMAARVVTTLLTEMDELGVGVGGSEGADAPVVVLATTNRLDAVDGALRRPGRFDRELHVGVPSPADREEILQLRLRGMRHALADADVAALAAAAHGYVGADLDALVGEASMAALRRIIKGPPAATTAATNSKGDEEEGDAGPELRVTVDDFKAAETRVRPSGLREVAVEVPRCGWGDVGGLDGVKQRLREAVQWPQQHARELARVGATPPRGVLLYGPPGCSKTLLARCVAGEAQLNFLAVKGPELYSKYVGESEKAVAALFARARAAAPAIIFFDELDGLAGSRGGPGANNGGGGDGGGGSSVSDRVLSQMLTEMDGLQHQPGADGDDGNGGGGGVVVLAATNRPDCVDPALLRPGRFDRLLFVPPPDAQGREAVLRVHTRATPLAADVDLQGLATRTDGFTGADLMSLVREASLAALQEDLGAREVASRHFGAALGSVHRSLATPEAAMAMYEGFQRSAA